MPTFPIWSGFSRFYTLFPISRMGFQITTEIPILWKYTPISDNDPRFPTQIQNPALVQKSEIRIAEPLLLFTCVACQDVYTQSTPLGV